MQERDDLLQDVLMRLKYLQLYIEKQVQLGKLDKLTKIRGGMDAVDSPSWLLRLHDVQGYGELVSDPEAKAVEMDQDLLQVRIMERNLVQQKEGTKQKD